ncbi:MAG: sodium:solute symporter family transporter, partial [Parachlamydiaceae bacterium]
FIGFWSIVIIYTVVGGLKAVVATDVVQALFFLIVFFASFAFALLADEYSLKDTLMTHSSASLSYEKIVGWLFMPMLFMIIEQDMAQRCFAANKPKTVTLATLVAGIVTLSIAAIPVFFGVLAKTENIEIKTGSSVLMMMIQTLSSPLLAAALGSAILAAIVSTADSLINAVSSNISQDFLPKSSVRTSQMITASIAILGIYLSFYFANIVDILIQSYELSVSCLFVPVAYILWKRSGPKSAAIGAILGGFIGFIGLRLYPLAFPRELLSLLISLVGFLIGYLIEWRHGVKNPAA